MKSRATEVISLLSSEIEQGIRNITVKDIPKSQIKREIERIKENAFKVERAPEAEFALQLYRRYADLAENLKAKHAAADKDNNSLLGDVPSYLYEATTEDIPSGNNNNSNNNNTPIDTHTLITHTLNTPFAFFPFQEYLPRFSIINFGYVQLSVCFVF